MATEGLAELIALEFPALPPSTNWPHKCDVCGCFVKLSDLYGKADADGEYWATAVCTHCGKRRNANPI